MFVDERIRGRGKRPFFYQQSSGLKALFSALLEVETSFSRG
jgi:hypothetical protein